MWITTWFCFEETVANSFQCFQVIFQKIYSGIFFKHIFGFIISPLPKSALFNGVHIDLVGVGNLEVVNQQNH